MPRARKKTRPHLAECLKSLRHGDTLVVWKLDWIGRDPRHLVNIVHDLTERGIDLKVLTGQGAAIDTTTASGKLVLGIFAALAEFERELISERTIAGLTSARARGREGGRPYKMTAAKVGLAMASMGQPDTTVGELCKELGITRQTLYRHVSPTGELRADGTKLLTGDTTAPPASSDVLSVAAGGGLAILVGTRTLMLTAGALTAAVSVLGALATKTRKTPSNPRDTLGRTVRHETRAFDFANPCPSSGVAIVGTASQPPVMKAGSVHPLHPYMSEQLTRADQLELLRTAAAHNTDPGQRRNIRWAIVEIGLRLTGDQH